MTLRATISARSPGLLYGIAVAAAVIFLAYAFARGGFLVTVVGFAAIYGVFVTGLNLFMGYAG